MEGIIVPKMLTSIDLEVQTLHGYNYIRDNLIVSDYPTACNTSLLKKLGITHIVACGFDAPPTEVITQKYGKTIQYFFLPGLLDLPLANILRFLPKVVTFIQETLEYDVSCQKVGSKTRQAKKIVLVHCAYGQSRSCTVCVAYLMRVKWDSVFYQSHAKESSEEIGIIRENFSQQLLSDCYEDVRQARPCIAINPGFMRQLEIYRRILTSESNILSELESKQMSTCSPFTSAYAYFRSSRIQSEIISCSHDLSPFFPSPASLRSSGFQIKEKIFRCYKCRNELFVKSNIIESLGVICIESLPVSEFCRTSAKGKSFLAGSLFASNQKHSDDPYLIQSDSTKIEIEPLDWMRGSINVSKNHGKVCCPNCNVKLGTFENDPHNFCFTIQVIRSKVE